MSTADKLKQQFARVLPLHEGHTIVRILPRDRTAIRFVCSCSDVVLCVSDLELAAA
jgi:hypothetical protein